MYTVFIGDDSGASCCVDAALAVDALLLINYGETVFDLAASSLDSALTAGNDDLNARKLSCFNESICHLRQIIRIYYPQLLNTEALYDVNYVDTCAVLVILEFLSGIRVDLHTCHGSPAVIHDNYCDRNLILYSVYKRWHSSVDECTVTDSSEYRCWPLCVSEALCHSDGCSHGDLCPEAVEWRAAAEDGTSDITCDDNFVFLVTELLDCVDESHVYTTVWASCANSDWTSSAVGFSVVSSSCILLELYTEERRHSCSACSSGVVADAAQRAVQLADDLHVLSFVEGLE